MGYVLFCFVSPGYNKWPDKEGLRAHLKGSGGTHGTRGRVTEHLPPNGPEVERRSLHSLNKCTHGGSEVMKCLSALLSGGELIVVHVKPTEGQLPTGQVSLKCNVGQRKGILIGWGKSSRVDVSWSVVHRAVTPQRP